MEEKVESEVFEGEVCSLKTETDSLYYEGVQIGFKVYKGYTIEESKTKPDTTGSSGYGSEATAQCSDYHANKLVEVEDDQDTNDTDSLSTGSSKGDFSSCRTEGSVVLMCVYCSRIRYERTGSVNDLKRLCTCEANEEYIRLAGLNRELVNQCDNQLNSRGTRLSTFSV